MTRLLIRIGRILVILVIISCATTDISSTWKNLSYQGQINKIMIIGLFSDPDQRRLCEDEFVKRFKNYGTDAIASYTLLPDQKQWPAGLIQETMKGAGADSVLIANLVDKKTVAGYMPGTADYPSPNYGTFYDSYRRAYSGAFTSGYVSNEQHAVVQTNIYDAQTEKLIWSARTDTEVNTGDRNFIKSFADTVANRMASQRLLAKT